MKLQRFSERERRNNYKFCQAENIANMENSIFNPVISLPLIDQ